MTEMRYLFEAPLSRPGPDRDSYMSFQAVLTMSINIDTESLRVCAGDYQMVPLQPIQLHLCKDALYALMRMQTPGATSLVLGGRH